MSYGMDYQGGEAYGGGFATGGDAYGTASSQVGGTQGGGNRRNYDEQTLIPVTARMILAAAKSQMVDNDELKLEDDRTLHRVKLVGAVRSVEQNSTNTQYTIEDGTGLVEVKQWVDENACSAQKKMMTAMETAEHQYVKVIGKIKSYDNKYTVMADSVLLLSTGNQLAHHYLEVVYSGEKYKNRSTIVQPRSPMEGISLTKNPSSGGVGFAGRRTGQALLMSQGGGGSGDEVRDAILKYMQRNAGASDFGANVDVCIKCHPQFDEARIRSAVEHLQSEGIIYSTIDENNFKCAM